MPTADELTIELDPDTERDAALTRVYSWYLHSAANARLTIGNLLPLTHVGTSEVEASTFGDSGQAVAWFDVERPTFLSLVHDAASFAEPTSSHGSARTDHDVRLRLV